MKFSKEAITELKNFFNEINNSENVKALKVKDPFNLGKLRKSFKQDEYFEFGLKIFLSNLPNKYTLPNLSPNKRNFDVAIFCIYIGAPAYLNKASEILKGYNSVLQQFETLGIPSLWFTEPEPKPSKPVSYFDAFKIAQSNNKKPAKVAVNAPDPSLYFEKRDNEEIDNCRLYLNAALFSVVFIASSYIAYKNHNVFSSLGNYFKNGVKSKLTSLCTFEKILASASSNSFTHLQ